IASEDSAKKGRALEELLALIIGSISGLVEFKRNATTETEEIDIVFRNNSPDLFWQRRGDLILVECKNWNSQRVGKNEFVLFHSKIKNRGNLCSLGFLVCTEDFAETVTKEMLRDGQSGLLVVPINGARLRDLVG